MPQGFLKKIKFDLLLTDLAFELNYAATSLPQRIGTTLFSRSRKTCRQVLRVWWSFGRSLLWTPWLAWRQVATNPQLFTPSIQALAMNTQFISQPTDILSVLHPKKHGEFLLFAKTRLSSTHFQFL